MANWTQQIINNVKSLKEKSSLLSSGNWTDEILARYSPKYITDPYKKVTGGIDFKKFEGLNKKKEQATQAVATMPDDLQGILFGGMRGLGQTKPSLERPDTFISPLKKSTSIVANNKIKEHWVKNEIFKQLPFYQRTINNRNALWIMPYYELRREFPEVEQLEQRYKDERLSPMDKAEDVALDRIRLSQKKFTATDIYDLKTDTWRAKEISKEYIDPNKQLYDDFETTVELFAQSIPAGLVGYETEAYKKALENGDFLAKFAASSGNLLGFVGGLKGVGLITKGLGLAGKVTTGLTKIGISERKARIAAELIKSGVDFTLLGQVHSTVRGDSWKEHFKSAGMDFLSGVGLTIGGMAVSKLPKLMQPLVEGSVWAGIAKAQGADNQTALIQGILFGGMRGFGLMKPSLEGVNEMTADKFLTEAEKFLKVKRTDTKGIVEAFEKKTRNLKQGTLEYQKAEASVVALLYPRQVFGMVKNVGSFQESRPVGLFGKGKFAAGQRPGIEKPAPLPKVSEEILDSVSRKAYERITRGGGVTMDLNTMKIKEGIAFSPTKKTEFKILLKDFTPDGVKSFIKRNYGQLKGQGKIGGWINPEDGNVYLDISKVLPEAKAEQAIKEARGAEQLSVYNLGKKNYQPLDERSVVEIAEALRGDKDYISKDTGKYANEIGDVGKVKIEPSGTNRFVDNQRRTWESLSVDQQAQYLRFKKKSAEVHEEFKDNTLKLGEELGLKISSPEFMRKFDGRAIEKMFPESREGYISTEIVYDMNRGAMESNNFSKYPEYIKQIKDKIFNGNVFRVKNFIKKPTSDGYRAIIINGFLPNGTIAEFQIIPKTIGATKPKVHPLYEITRGAKEGVKEIPNLAFLKRQERDLFNKAWKSDKPEYLKYKDVVDKIDFESTLKTDRKIGIGGEKKLTPQELYERDQKLERGFIKSVKEKKPELAARVAGQYIPRSTDELSIKARNLIKDNIVKAEELAKTGDSDASIAVASELIKHYSELAGKSPKKEIANNYYDKAAEIANLTAEKLTEQGRAVQAASILGRLTPEGQLRFAAREIQKYNEMITRKKGGLFGLKKKIPELTPEQTKKILEDAKRIQEMKDGPKKAMEFKKLQNNIADLTPTPLYQKLIALWKAGLLTGLKTSGLNIMSNLFHGISEIAKDIPSVAVDSLSKVFTGKRTLAFTLKGYTQGAIKEGISKGFRYIKTGYDERNIGAKLDYKRVNFGKNKFAKTLQFYEEGIFRIIGAEDQPFFYGAKARSLYSQAIAEAKNRGLKGQERIDFVENLVSNPTNDMLRIATNDAEVAVFQNRTLLGEAAKAIQRIPGGEIVVPFGRTPSAVAMQLVNYSPVGVVKTIVENIGKGRFNQREFSQGLGRGMTGTSVLFIGMSLFQAGMISLGRPESERERKQWELEGRKPNSIKIGGKWRSLNTLGPLGSVVTVGGYIQQGVDETGSLTEGMIQATAGAGKTLTDQTFLIGIDRFTQAIKEPTKYAGSYLKWQVASIVPTIVSDIAKSADDIERRSDDFFDPLIARVPILRTSLPPKINVLGRPIEVAGNALETLLDPTRPSKIQSSSLIEELKRLAENGYIATPTEFAEERKYNILTDDQKTKLLERAGTILEGKLNNLIVIEDYKNLSDEEKSKIIQEFADKSRILARAELVNELTMNLEGEEKRNKLSELKKAGIITSQVFDKYIELFE